MCGIAGFAFTDPRHPVDRELLGRMTDILRHRGRTPTVSTWERVWDWDTAG